MNIAVSAAVALIGSSILGYAVWPRTPESALTGQAFASGMRYSTGTIIGGIEWKDKYAYISFPLWNNSESMIQNVDLTLEIDALIWDVGQLTDVPGVNLVLQNTTPDRRLRLESSEGGSAIISLRDLQMLGDEKPPSPGSGSPGPVPNILRH